MTTIAVTGHMNLTPDSVPLVRNALKETLGRYAGSDLVGVSCLARGADSLFAEAVLAAGGRLVAVLPTAGYRQHTLQPGDVPLFDRLLAAAYEVIVLPYDAASPRAYEAANAQLLDRADRLVAVWDGRPPAGRGGTADVVRQARVRGLPVDVTWPPGARRET